MSGQRGDRDGEGDAPDAAASPWATDDIVAGPAPEFEWDQGSDATDDDTPPATDRADRRNQALIAVGCVVALIVGALVLWPRDDKPTDSADDTDTTETTLDTLPSPDDDAPDTGSSGGAAPGDAAGGDESAGGKILDAAPASPDGDVSSIELPDAVAAITEPTEVVLFASGEIITVSLPSGNVRSVESSRALDGNVVIAPDAIGWYFGSGLNIVPRAGPPFTVNLESLSGGGYVMDWLTDESGSTRFFFNTFDQGTNRQYTVGLDGDVEEYESISSRVDTDAFYGGLHSGTREGIINDAGGVYRIGADDDIERISTGEALASNEDFVLLRECDEVLDCGHIILDRTTGERHPSPVTTEQLGQSYGFDLAPDGSATLAYDSEGQQRNLVDLVEGSVVTALALSNGPNRNSQWAADSSGVFVPNPSGSGIDFVDRETGESVQFATELGQIYGLGTRRVDTELGSFGNVVATRPITFTDEPSAPIGIDLVVLGALGSMAHLDLDDAIASIWSAPAVASTNEPDLVAIGAEIMVLPPDPENGFLTTFGHTEMRDDTEQPGFPRFPGPAPNLVWSPTDGSVDGVDHELLAIDAEVGASASGEVTLRNSELLGEDGTGRLVARVGGDIFVVGVDDSTRLTDGDLLALGPNHALVRTCDDVLACHVDRIDRTTGDVLDAGNRSPEVAGALTTAGSVGEPRRSPRLGDTISPDGTAAFVRTGLPGPTAQWLLVDFATSDRYVVPSPVPGQPIIWNSDGSTAVYLSEHSLRIVERSTRRALMIKGLGEVRAITAVDADFAEATHAEPSD